MSPVILHAEDNLDIVEAVALAFHSFGFLGEMLHADSAESAIEIVRERRESGRAIDLIIVDMNLRQGTGLDIIRNIKMNPLWAHIPVIVLSSDVERRVVAEAYALGANCYFPKLPAERTVLDTLEGLYRCWFKLARTARGSTSPASEILGRAVSMKAQASQLYMSFARLFAKDEGASRLLLELAMDESNHANLLAFFRLEQFEESALERLKNYIAAKEACLLQVHGKVILRPNPALNQIAGWALELEQAFDPAAVSLAIGCLFPNCPAATTALTGGTINHLAKIIDLAKIESADPELRRDAESLQRRLDKLKSFVRVDARISMLF